MKRFSIIAAVGVFTLITAACTQTAEQNESSGSEPVEQVETGDNEQEQGGSHEALTNKSKGDILLQEYTVLQGANLNEVQTSGSVDVTLHDFYIVKSTKTQGDHYGLAYVYVKNTGEESVILDFSAGFVPDTESRLLFNDQDIAQEYKTHAISPHLTKNEDQSALLWFPLNETNPDTLTLVISGPYLFPLEEDSGSINVEDMEALSEEDKISEDILFEISL
ncbi:hypothetical protein [Salipaludibacillus aurantiacus]|uniref:DUF4352 domain-containing protein n=1 Tax=Salipaludibacillus aurantiacus TaxID=1601833 RepID=A0A1H9UDT6_9BACI|nr:hypothetical protein [Salipaludibacillus aurantiacus]SES07431.1 hypothetical protein SAMN05518684_107142 [Salipaludibacillus aurantiacus]